MFTIIDRTTGWPEAMPLESTNAKHCTEILIHNWISRFGVPHTITSDRGPQFISKIWNEMCRILGIKLDRTTSYHPQHNGKIERMHRTLKNMLRTKLNGKADWLKELPWCLLNLRNVPNCDTGISPAMMVYGQTLDLPGQIVLQKHEIKPEDSFSFASNLSKHLKEQNIVSTQWHGKNKSYVPKSLNNAKYVLVRKDENHIPSLSPKYNGPYKVLQRQEKHMFWTLKTKLILFQLTDWFLFNYVKIDWKGDVVPIPHDAKEVLLLSDVACPVRLSFNYFH